MEREYVAEYHGIQHLPLRLRKFLRSLLEDQWSNTSGYRLHGFCRRRWNELLLCCDRRGLQ